MLADQLKAAGQGDGIAADELSRTAGYFEAWAELFHMAQRDLPDGDGWGTQQQRDALSQQLDVVLSLRKSLEANTMLPRFPPPRPSEPRIAPPPNSDPILSHLVKAPMLRAGTSGTPLDSPRRPPYTKGNATPPSSSGLGHSPLKAKTGVRVPLGVLLWLVSTCVNLQILARSRNSLAFLLQAFHRLRSRASRCGS